MKGPWLNKAVPLWLVLAVLLATAAATFAATLLLPPDVRKETFKALRPIRHEVTVDIVQVDASVKTIDLNPWSYTTCTKDDKTYSCPIITLVVNFAGVPAEKPPIRVSVEILQAQGGTVAWGSVTLNPDDYEAGDKTIRITMELDNPDYPGGWVNYLYNWMKYVIVKLEPLQ